jgi:tetratricopeptide (TPR) repeat protein
MITVNETVPTVLTGIRYFTAPAGYLLSGREGRVGIVGDGLPPIPLLEEDFNSAQAQGAPDYDMVGRGLFQALRLDPECVFAAQYAALLKAAYPHIVSELGSQIIMLDAKELDTPYLDRKISLLRIMALLDPENAGLNVEIARTFTDKGSRISSLHLAVDSWYKAEKYFKKARQLDPNDHHAAYEYGEALYVLGRYEQAAEAWQTAIARFDAAEQRRIEVRIAAILSFRLPKVPPVDYLTAISVAVEEHHAGHDDQAAAIIEDVLSDSVFSEQFPVNGIYYLLGSCYQRMGMVSEAAAAFKRS